MPHFRCYCRDRDDEIVARHDIVAPDLKAALREARWLCGINSVQLWQGVVLVNPVPNAAITDLSPKPL
jgi:hypothetical protein